MDWNDLRYLLAIKQRGSLAAAAKALRVTKATVSRRLAALERAAGARLFDRKPTGVELTAAGLEVAMAAEEMSARLGTLEERIAQKSDAVPRGTVRFTSPPWFATRVIIPTLTELSARFPDLDVQLVSSDHVLNLVQGEADLALRNVRPKQSSLVARKICVLGGCVYASKAYLARKHAPKDRGDLERHDVLAYEGLGGMPGFEWLREAATKRSFRADGPEGLMTAAAAGLGLAAIPCLLGDSDPVLVRVASLGFATCDIFLVTSEQLRNAPRIRAVGDHIAAVVGRKRDVILGSR